MDGACEYKLIKTFMVTEEKLATSVGSGSVEVLATPMVAAMMEKHGGGPGSAGIGCGWGRQIAPPWEPPFP